MYKINDNAYDAAIIGMTADGRAIYDHEAMVECLMKRDSMTMEDAIEFIELNTAGVISRMGANAPIIMYKLDEVTDLSDAPEEIKKQIVRNAKLLNKRDRKKGGGKS